MVVVLEGNKEIAFHNREKAINHYKERALLAWNKEDAVSFRRIVETLKSTDTERVSDSHNKEKHINSVIKNQKEKGEARLFRLGDTEVLRIVKDFKGAGFWYDIILHDGTSDYNNRLVLSDEHIMHHKEVYHQQFREELHKAIFRIGEWE